MMIMMMTKEDAGYWIECTVRRENEVEIEKQISSK